MSHPPTDEQVEALDLVTKGGPVTIEALAGTGKALRDDQPILTPTGWKAIATLNVGDEVIGSDGRATTVIGVYPQGERPLYEVTTSDGVVIIADADHLWLTQTTRDREAHRDLWLPRTTTEVAATLRVRDGQRVNHYLPMLSAPVVGEDAVLPLDPWLIGMLVADGTLHGQVGLSNPDPLVLAQVRRTLPAGVALVPQDPSHPGKDWRFHSTERVRLGHRGFWNPVTEALKDLGLWDVRSPEKCLPEIVLRASAAQRLGLLQGLMDGDGYANGTTVEWSTTSAKLAEQVGWLVQSLGGTFASRWVQPSYPHQGEKRLGQPACRMWPRLPIGMAPFAHSAKVARWTPRSKYSPRRQITEVRPVEPAHATCIAVAAHDHLYVTAGCVLTHNTTTLEMIARSNPERRFQYLAFNKALVTDAQARFPANTAANTIHSIAHRGGNPHRHRFGGARVPAWKLASALGIRDIEVTVPMGRKRLAAGFQAGLVMRALRNFCASDSPTPSMRHFPAMDGIDEPRWDLETGRRLFGGPNRDLVARALLPALNKAWLDWLSPTGTLPYDHAAYLKAFELDYPVIPCDVLMLDEAQDLSPVMASIVRQQTDCQLVYVGDEHQAIYGFTGAINAMADHPGDRTWLTQSFRFGPEVARVANACLARLGATKLVRGTDSIESHIGMFDRPAAMLHRTNAGVIDSVIDFLDRGMKPAVVGGTGPLVAFARAAQELQQVGRTGYPDLACFDSWAEVQKFVEDDPQGDELSLFVGLIDKFGVDEIIALLSNLPSEHKAEVVLSTAHVAKGREWATVRLNRDFNRVVDGVPVLRTDDEEKRLLYVAVTRARLGLDVTDLPELIDLTEVGA